MKKLLVLLFIVFMAVPVHAANINLSTWTAVGSGNWNVGVGNDYVVQTLNTSSGTYFLSGTDYLDSVFEGSFQVNDGDDDYIGFVFGYKGSDDYYLFDWKQKQQSAFSATAYEGFTLSHVTAATTNTHFWGHTGMTVLDTDYGTGRGWANNTPYIFKLTYTASLIEIAIDGGTFNDETIFSIGGTYETGKFGFYNFSQPNVSYQGFTEEVAPTVPVPSTLLLFYAGILGFTGITRKKS